MKRVMRATLLTLLLLICGGVSSAQTQPDNCALKFEGSARGPVKTRSKAEGANYTRHNNLKPITITDWFNLVCPFEANLPKKVPGTKAMQGFETIKVTVRGFLLGAKFEGGAEGDHDIHAEIGETADWDTRHVVVELSPAPEYCDARKTLWGLITADRLAAKGKKGPRWIMKRPVEVLITGYVFLDNFHGSHAFCTANGGRGLQKDGQGSKVQGLWEIHPVTDVRVVGQE